MEVREGCALAITETWLVQSMTANEGCSQPQLQTLCNCHMLLHICNCGLGFIQRGGTLGFPPPSHSPRLINGSTCTTIVYV